MTSKDIDFTKVSLPADDFDAIMRRALDAPPPAEPASKGEKPKAKSKKDDGK